MAQTATPAGRERRRIVAPLALISGSAWLLLALSGSSLAALPALCSSAQLWSVPAPETFGFFFAFVPVRALALGWALMVAAMMLPVLGETLAYVRARSFARLRGRAALLTTAGYAGVWLMAGPLLLGLALSLRLAVASGLMLFLCGLALALVWQTTPLKQHALNRCHRRPALPAFAPALWGAALRLGIGQGFWCLASCWPLMLLGLLAPDWHFAIMALVAFVIWAERLEPPRPPVWQFRLPRRLLRQIAYRTSRITPG